MALRVHPAGKGEAHQLERGGRVLARFRIGLPEGHAAHLHGTHAAGDKHFVHQGDAGKLEGRDMRMERAGVQVDGVASARSNDGNA